MIAKGLYVTLYLVRQAYGGPEEGGWWYDFYEGETALYIPAGSQQQRKIRKAVRELQCYVKDENLGYCHICKERILWANETKNKPIYE